MEKKHIWTIAIALIVIAAATRLLPHAPNIAAVSAVGLFAALYLPKRAAFLVPMAAMLVSDLFIGFYSPLMMGAVYGSFLLTVFLGLWVRKHKSVTTILGGTLFAAVLFYLITNAAVWAFGTMYPHTLAGLGQSYINAIPFFRNSLMGDILYVSALVGSIELVLLQKKQQRVITQST